MIAAGADLNVVVEPAPAPNRLLLEYQRDLQEDLFSTDFDAQTTVYHLDLRPQDGDGVIIGASSHDDDFVIVVGVIWAYDNNNFSPDDPDQSYSEYFSNGGGFSFVVGDITTAQHTRHVFGATHSIVESGGPIGEFFIPLYEASDAYVQELIETGIWAGTVAATSVPPARSEQAQSV